MASHIGPRSDRPENEAWTEPGARSLMIRLLGPVGVFGPNGRAEISRGYQRSLLSVLALAAGKPQSSDRLLEAVWDEADQPDSGRVTLRGHVHRLRQSLLACGLPDDLLVTSGATYTLRADRSDIDAFVFEDILADIRAVPAEHTSEPSLQRLRDGLALWRGEALQDVMLYGWATTHLSSLIGLRLSGLEYLCRAELQAGRADVVVRELARVVPHHPGHELLAELLMRAYVRCGQSTDALEVYDRLWTALDERGKIPAPELRQLHARIKRGEPGLTAPRRVDLFGPRPAQLPGRVGYWVGREAEMSALRNVLDGAADSRVAVVYGAGGMGKTGLVLQWAHSVRDRFPDGQVFMDLRGHDEQTAMSAEAAAARVLTALGAAPGRLPDGIDERIDWLRTLLDGRRILIVLDNALNAAQVQSLVPPTPTSMLVVTSRRPMPALATFHAVQAIPVQRLVRDDSLQLLRNFVGDRRIDLEPAAAVQIVERCAGMPLALRIAGARASHTDEPLAELAAELAGDGRLDALRVDDGLRDVRSVLASGYRSVSAPAALVFRQLGLHPGEVFGPHLAAAVVQLPDGDTDAALTELVEARLLEETVDGRYSFHDLVRDYAAEQARLDPESSAEAVTRLVDWYLAVAELANRIIEPTRDDVRPQPSVSLPEPPFPADRRSALAFLDRERTNLLPLVRFAVRQAHEVAAWQLTYLLTGYYDSRGEWDDRVKMCREALAGAGRLEDSAAESLMGAALGTAYLRMLRYNEAFECLPPAMRKAQVAGDQRLESRIRNFIGSAQARLRRFDEAIETYQQALAVHQRIGDRLGEASALNNIAAVRVFQGRPELAFAPLDKALRLVRELEDQRVEAVFLGTLGEAHVGQGTWQAAVATFAEALRLQVATDDRRHQVDTQLNIGQAYLVGDQHLSALDHYGKALALSRELSDQHLAARCHQRIAEAHLRRGELDLAAQCLRDALTARLAVPDPYEEATIRQALGEVAERTGQVSVAAEHRRQAESLYLAANAHTEAAAVRSR